MLQDTQLMALILVLLLIDCVIATLWVTFDPLQRQLRNLTMEYAAADRGVVYLPQVRKDTGRETSERRTRSERRNEDRKGGVGETSVRNLIMRTK